MDSIHFIKVTPTMITIPDLNYTFDVKMLGFLKGSIGEMVGWRLLKEKLYNTMKVM